MSVDESYQVIIVGGGHAGTEAALASARMGLNTLLLTQNIDTLGQMSCNPAIGGIGKGHLVKEIDALDGAMGRAADKAGIQFRTLNASKGPAVRATRAQADRMLYKQAIRQILENQSHLTICQQSVDDLIIESGAACGVVTQMGLCFRAQAVVLTVGTFLGGKIHIGTQQFGGGRAGCPASNKLAETLRALPFRVGRLKTGTPPRLDGRSLDYTVMDTQPGDDPRPCFSFLGSPDDHPKQVPCHITHTTAQTQEIILQNLDQSPMYSGQIDATGPRYCPSIEDKIVRFSDKPTHQIFVEPEGLTVNEIYPNGISTGLPYEVQKAFVQSIKGFEKAIITRPAYAIEYDYFDPRDLKPSLETQFVDNLFFAGQINGTTGYEEAAAQGLIAGLNAGRKVQGLSTWCPRRDEAYIGVLIDDLITRGTIEPYRMFTSRAEYRLLLREDNADERLTDIGYELGVVGEKRHAVYQTKKTAIDDLTTLLKKRWIQAGSSEAKQFDTIVQNPFQKETNVLALLKRPELNYETLCARLDLPAVSDDISLQVEIKTKYAGYIDRQKEEIARLRRNEMTLLPQEIDYRLVKGLSAEVIQKLNDVKPSSIGQASRISGVTPAAISLLLVHLKKNAFKKERSYA